MAGEKILVIDDSHPVADYLSGVVLKEGGYQTLVAYRAQDGLKAFRQSSPDLVLLDAQLPDQNGLEVLRTIMSESPHTPVILMTAFGSESLAVEAFRLGARDYLIKPAEAADVLRAVERALTETRLRREKQRLTQHLERQVQRLSVLARIGQEVTSLLDLDTLLTRIVEAAVYLTHAEEGFLMLLDERTDELILRAGKNLGDKSAVLMRVPVQDTLVGTVVRTGQPQRLAGHGTQRDFKLKTGYFVRALLHVPVKLKGRVIGVLSVDQQKARHGFTQDDESLLMALADYAAIAIENARLYQEVQLHAMELERANLELKEMDRLKSQFMQNVSHELRTPLVFIRAYLDLLLHGELGPLSEEQHKALSIVTAKAETLTSLVNQITTFHRIKSGLADLGKVQLEKIAQASLDGAREAARKAGIVLHSEFAPDLAPVWGDAGQLSQVFDNLLSNAIKFSPNGGNVWVRLRSDSTTGMVIAEVQDEGIGIPRDQHTRIFERFYQVDGTTTRKYGGTGLGLAIVREIVEAHGGQVWVESEPGRGSTFYVAIPQMVESPPPAETPEADDVPLPTETAVIPSPEPG